MVATKAARATILRSVEIFFTSLLVFMGLLTTWFAGYVLYRIYADQR